MDPAPRPDPDPGLDELRRMYEALPHPLARWRTVQGLEFLAHLTTAVSCTDERTVARGLGLTVQGVEYMLTRRRPRRPIDWPTPTDLRALHAAWRPVQAASAARQTIRRQSPQYVPVYLALKDLSEKYDLADVALAAGIPLRQLKRFTIPPMDSPEAVARAIRDVLPIQTAPRDSDLDRTSGRSGERTRQSWRD